MKNILEQGKEKTGKWMTDIKEAVKKTGYVKVIVLVVLALILLVFSFPETNRSKGQKNGDKHAQSESTKTGVSDYEAELESRLIRLLSKVDGVGKVSVMITLKAGAEQVVDKDSNVSSVEQSEENKRSASGSREDQTVLLEDGSGSQSPYVVKEIKPEVAGVVIICEGGDDPKVVSEIVASSEVLFSISAHKIKVMKMK